MKHSWVLLALGLSTSWCAAEPPAVVPKPAAMTVGTGTFTFTANTTIGSDRQTTAEAQFLADWINPPSGFALKVQPSTGTRSADVQISVDPSVAGGPEAYALSVTPKAIVVRGASPAGAFYALQTLRQLLPKEVESRQKVAGVAWTVPAVEIKDAPRFPWRGMMLDVSRHFFSKDEVKQLLDAMALQKMNVFHWHLVDDNGWRIEIKKYPKLTQEGAWRKGVDFGLDPKSGTAWGPDGRYGGFYTQDDIREVVAYAAARHIAIVPEIEMPGHAGAALGAYPAFNCEGKPGPNVYCAGNDATYAFLQDVLTEVFGLFPSKYIHIGGDEVNKGFWKKCEKCQAREKAEGLKTEHELQSYFVRRMETFITAKGKTLIGWSEIREGGLAPSAVVMDWIGGAVEAAGAGHDVVMSPISHCYFDYYQAKHGDPRAIGGYVPLKTVYAFEPVPRKLAPEFHKHILGAQGNVWTEYIPNMKHVEFMAFPRGCALAEVAWSPAAARNYEDFLARLPALLARLDAMGVNYRKLTPEPAVAASWKSGQTTPTFAPLAWDVSKSVSGAGKYEATFQYTGGSCRLDIEWAALFVNGREVARDAHAGVTGASTKDNVYRFKLDAAPAAGEKCELKASVRSDGGTDSNGDITLQRVE